MARQTWHPGALAAPEPLAMWDQVIRAAVADTGAPDDQVLASVGSLAVLYCQSWPYDDPPGRLCASLGISPSLAYYSGIGGTTPQLLVEDAAARIARGELDVAVVVAGEALYTARQARKAGERPAWSHRDPHKKPFPFEAPLHPAEVAHSVFEAWLTFATFDVARRAWLGADPLQHRVELGKLLAPLSAVAEANPHAWRRRRLEPQELIEPTPSNRMVGYPYTKAMVAVMDVDMAAALVLASDRRAAELGVPSERRVYLQGAGHAEDPLYVAEHDPMWASPGMAQAARTALQAGGVDLDGVAHLDLYSCFASSLCFACDALGIAPGDPRGLTVTGGLPFAGGPGSGYMLHSIAAMAEVLRADPGSYGLVSGVGMHMTKHAFALYSTLPPRPNQVARLANPQPATPPPTTRPIAEVFAGRATVAAYTVAHARSGEPQWGLAICEVGGGARAYARVEDSALLASMEKEEWVGSEVDLEAGPDRVNRIVG